MSFIKKNKDTYYKLINKDKLSIISKEDLEYIVKKSKTSKRKRSRICIHKEIKSKIHEMFIHHPKGTYVRPHKNTLYDESFLLIKGRADLILFNNIGKVTNIIELDSKKKKFYYKLLKNNFHSQIFYQDSIFYEVTQGPFKKNNNIFAKWSPTEENKELVKDFIKGIKNTIKK